MRVFSTFLLFAICFAVAVTGARLRGSLGVDSMNTVAAQSSPFSQAGGDLVNFLQQHQRAFQAQSSPQQAAQQAASPMGGQPQQASEASSGSDILQALEHAPRSLVQTGVQAREPGEEGDGEPFGPCKTCVFVLERIKKGSNMLLPAICSELYHKYPDAYALCHQVLNALSINGNNVRYWLFEGCFKYEIYQSKEWIKPCPSHVMCSVLKDLSAAPFCPALPMENPFADA